MKQLTDEEIMIQVSSGNLDMMSILFERYHVRLFNFLLKMTRDKDASQDLTQEVFYKAIKYRRSYKKGKFSSWMYTIARNCFSDYYQTKKTENQRFEDVEFKTEKKEQNTIENNETIEQLNQALAQLSNSDKELIVMNRYQGIKYQEIAEITGSTAGAVKTKVHRALHKLKDLYLQKV